MYLDFISSRSFDQWSALMYMRRKATLGLSIASFQFLIFFNFYLIVTWVRSGKAPAKALSKSHWNRFSVLSYCSSFSSLSDVFLRLVCHLSGSTRAALFAYSTSYFFRFPMTKHTPPQKCTDTSSLNVQYNFWRDWFLTSTLLHLHYFNTWQSLEMCAIPGVWGWGDLRH